MRLSRSDLEGALTFIREAGDLSGEEPFPPHLLDRLVLLLGSADALYDEIDETHRKSTYSAITATPFEVPEEAFWTTVHEHPIGNHRRSTGELRALKIYDFVTPRELRRTQFYADFVRPFATPFMMSLRLAAPPGYRRTFTFVREQRDFGERERALLDLLAPHLVQIRHAAELRLQAQRPLRAPVCEDLTARETEILAWVAEGLSNRAIAETLWISPGTVRRHLDNIYAKLGAHTRTAAVRIAQHQQSLSEAGDA